MLMAVKKQIHAVVSQNVTDFVMVAEMVAEMV